MEPKTHQRAALADLQRFLDLLQEKRNTAAAFKAFWKDTAPALGKYQDILPGVPTLCFKVPTGGGKTFLACNAIRPIFQALPPLKCQVLVWLVPSEAILSQTLKALKDSRHPYRQRLDLDFSGQVRVYAKEELLQGQNFSLEQVKSQLSVMVLSYDSFRGRGKDVLKVYQENGALAEFAEKLGEPEVPIANAEAASLFQVINQLHPLVIVDESHHARSELSLAMLKDFNPSFVLDLTATPRPESNVISYTDALLLKKEHMVKLPVVVYNRDSKTDVLLDAVDLRGRLECQAREEAKESGRNIRPIVLFQAETKGREDSATFERLKEKLVEMGVKAEEIAIRTATMNELKGVDLLAASCPVRYIITVNALKEGWDCPFAYVLASVANRNSPVEVEQILGRVLRQPYAQANRRGALNMAYVLTSSADFSATVQQIVKGLNHAGFSAKDYRLADPEAENVDKAKTPENDKPVAQNLPLVPQDGPEKLDFSDLNGQELKAQWSERQAEAEKAEANPDSEANASNPARKMLEAAAAAEQDFAEAAKNEADEAGSLAIPAEVRSKMQCFGMKAAFRAEAGELLLPQFVQRSMGLFGEGDTLLSRETLAASFSLKGQPYDVDFDAATGDLTTIDLREGEDGLPKVYKMTSADQRYFLEYFNTLPPERKRKERVRQIYDILNKSNLLDGAELKVYVQHIVDDMDKMQLEAMEKAPVAFAKKIQSRIDALLTEHGKKAFFKGLEKGEILCCPFYRLPKLLHPARHSTDIGASLYEAEGEMNSLERALALELTALENIKWWHRNGTGKEDFRINGFLNHYPDLMAWTEKGTLILTETKGEQLKNDDSRDKLELGKAWQNAAGPRFRYFMVFADGVRPIPGGQTMKEFLEIAQAL